MMLDARPRAGRFRLMIELAKTFDPVHLSFLRAVLAEAGVAVVVLDAGAGAILPGAIPTRLMVAERDAWRARRALADAGVEEE
jgi:hypothetical protein